MVIKWKQLLLRAGIVLAFLILFAGLFALMRRQPPAEDILLETDAAREAWLNLRGWRVDAPLISEEVLPEEWVTLNGQRWLAIQQEQGLSPEKYAGRAVTRYRYPVINGESEEIYAELYLCGDTLCGAEIYDAGTQIMRPVR